MRENHKGGRAESFRAKLLHKVIIILYIALIEAYMVLRVKENYKNV